MVEIYKKKRNIQNHAEDGYGNGHIVGGAATMNGTGCHSFFTYDGT